jgi:hypothetical protein
LSDLAAWIRQQRWLRTAYALVQRRSSTAHCCLDANLTAGSLSRTANWAGRSMASVANPGLGTSSDRFNNALGVNLFAYFRGQFGIAEGARSYARALLSVGYPVALHDIAIDVPHSMGDSSLDDWIAGNVSPPHGVNLVFVSPASARRWKASVGNA